MEGLSVSDANLVVYVHPSQTKNVSQAILRELSSLLFKFIENFDGVVLAYDVNPSNNYARILSGVHPYCAVKLKAKLLLFSPKTDMVLEGKVVKVTRESIHAIVLGFSSTIITDEDIRDEFRYKSKHGERAFVSRSHKHHKIKIGTVIRFVVKSLDEEILHISGSLKPGHTGSVRWLDKYSVDVATDSGVKKRKENEGEGEVEDHGTLDRETPLLDNDHKSKKSKKC